MLELSPFVVTDSQDNGYQVTGTLADARLHPDLKAIGAAAAQDYGARLAQFVAHLRCDLRAPSSWFVHDVANPPYAHTAEVVAARRPLTRCARRRPRPPPFAPAEFSHFHRGSARLRLFSGCTFIRQTLIGSRAI